MQDPDREVAWSLYWSQDRLHSCVASQDADDQRILDEEWARFARYLPGEARVLDLATGNGAVPKALLAARTDLRIDAVDRAAIDPMQFLSDKDGLDKVRFHAQTDILDMPFSAGAFDAITSQFGIEYAGLTEAARLAGRLLKAEGKLLFFVHHSSSELIQASKQKKVELQQLVNRGGLLDDVKALLAGQISIAELELQGEKYLHGEYVRTQAISGQVFQGIGQVMEMLGSDTEQARQLAAGMDLRVRSEYQRLCQMIAAAQSEQSLIDFSKAMQEIGISVDFGPLSIDKDDFSYLLCWRVQGSK